MKPDFSKPLVVKFDDGNYLVVPERGDWHKIEDESCATRFYTREGEEWSAESWAKRTGGTVVAARF